MDSAFVEFRHVYAGYSPAKGMSALFSSKQSDSNMVLNDVSLSLHAKDHIVLFGPSASGKSTLLRLMCGAHIPHEGTIIVNGKKPEANPSAKLGYRSHCSVWSKCIWKIYASTPYVWRTYSP